MKRTLIAAIAATLSMPAFAGSEITIEDAYARAAGMNAMAGAAFFTIVNAGDEDDRLIDARSEASAKVELHTHIEGEGGVMQMVHVQEGFPVPAGTSHELVRGADHVMFMGLKEGFENGNMLDVTLVFEKAGEIEVVIPVDNDRQPQVKGQGMMNHGNMGNAGMGASN